MIKLGRSREGAWIEIAERHTLRPFTTVAPVRERGLKYPYVKLTGRVGVVAPAKERGLKYA